MITDRIEEAAPTWCLQPKVYTAIRERVLRNLERLPFDVSLRANDIYGRDAWQTIDHHTKRQFGRYIAFMVEVRDIPIVISPESWGPLRSYIRI